MGEEGVGTAIWSLNTMKTTSTNKEKEIEKENKFIFLCKFAFFCNTLKSIT